MKYVLYNIDLINKSFEELISSNLVNQIELFNKLDPYKRYPNAIPNELLKREIINGQGWIASTDYIRKSRYVVLFKKSEGIFEHFLHYAYHSDKLRKIVNRTINLEKLLNDEV